MLLLVPLDKDTQRAILGCAAIAVVGLLAVGAVATCDGALVSRQAERVRDNEARRRSAERGFLLPANDALTCYGALKSNRVYRRLLIDPADTAAVRGLAGTYHVFADESTDDGGTRVHQFRPQSGQPFGGLCADVWVETTDVDGRLIAQNAPLAARYHAILASLGMPHATHPWAPGRRPDPAPAPLTP